MSKLWVVGIGPGDAAHMTAEALVVLEAADVICGYATYVKLAAELVPGKETHATRMGDELDRCRWALEAAASGLDVALVCSGDAGVYGMAGPVLELAEGVDGVEVAIIPGVTAALSGAAVLGAPLMNDFCVISLSDYLTPWQTIAHRLRCAGEAGMAICLYNPASRKRPDHLRRACDILLQVRDGGTPCGWVRNIGREGQEHKILTLAELRTEELDMFTTVFVGASQTVVRVGRLITSRGYQSATEDRLLSKRILLFGGTTEGRLLAQELAQEGHDVTVSVATEVGAEELAAVEGIAVRVGRLDADGIAALLEAFDECIDATHPYAQVVSANVREACERTGTPLRRVERTTSDVEGCTVVSSMEQAARFFATTEGNILVTTGSKELAALADLDPARLVVRVLPTHEALDACERLGVPHRNIITGQGPFSRELNEAHMRQYDIRWLLTKDGGRAGGFDQKLSAARACNVDVVLVARPGGYLKGQPFGDCPLRADVEVATQADGRARDCPRTAAKIPLPKHVSLVGAGSTGTDLTTHAAAAIAQADLIVGAERLVTTLPSTDARVEVATRASAITQLLRTSDARRAVVVLSGDVGFYSGASSLAKLLRADRHEVELIPGISSVQQLSARLGRPWQDWTLRSVHGRDCDVIGALRSGHPLFLLTAGAESVRTVCRTLVEAGLAACEVTVAERLGYGDERVTSGSAERMATGTYDELNVMLIDVPTDLVVPSRTPGLPDDVFVRGKVPMTKQEVRACVMAKLAVTPDDVCWDVGAGTGAVSVELALASREVWAIEQNPVALDLIAQNRTRFRAWNLRAIEGTAPAALDGLPQPDVVFVGGSAGNLEGILSAALAANPQVRICVCAILIQTLGQALDWMETHGLNPEVTQVAVNRTRKLAGQHMLQAENPVYVIVGART